ncbi:MAG: DNA repair protein RecN [Paludibacteraceae bacterium]
MLTSLYISNYALISELTINFENGLTVITGETGAGKSIIMGALSLVLGQRADTKSIKEGEIKSVVEARFEIKNDNLHLFFEQNELDYDEVCTIRREITGNGKSRAFINDTPVSLVQLRDLTTNLIDIHSQHENLLLITENYQIDFVDAVAQNQAISESYLQSYQKRLDTEKELKKIKQEIEQQNTDSDYLQFQYNQLSEASLQEEEQSELEEEQEILAHVEEIKRALQQVYFLLANDETNASKLLRDTILGLNRIANYLPESTAWTERLESILLEVKDITTEISRTESHTEFNPQRLQQVEERLNLIYSLQKKFKVENVEQLIELRDTFKNRLSQIENFDDIMRAAENELVQANRKMLAWATQLSKSRVNSIPIIENFLTDKLIALGIPDVCIKISIINSDTFTEKGNDAVQLLFSANKNRSLQPIAEVASGGEISRVMLAVKSLLVQRAKLPTIIFDEIDTGISGEIANRVGEIMQFMATTTQVITITHLPQIASKGEHHFKVYKDNDAENVITHITKLTPQEREVEIAQLLSGQNITEAALQNAKELLKSESPTL